MSIDPKVKEKIQNDESLEIFIEQMRIFNQRFCDFMIKGSNFTLRLEVRGNRNEMLHARVYTDDMKQPRGAQQRIDKKN